MTGYRVKPMSDILIVIPTLGTRPMFLEQTLASIKEQDTKADIVMVGPIEALQEIAARHGSVLAPDPGSLPAAINAGIRAAEPRHAFVTWLGDDDLLTPGSLSTTRQALVDDPDAVVAYGSCEYIDEDGRRLWTSRAGRAAAAILGWGPDLIPQPGMLVRAEAWRSVRGVDESLRFAFDLDLLLKLRQHGSLVDVGHVVSCFRWHPDSLTVSDRSASLDESEFVKRRHLSPTARSLAWLWERPVRVATRVAASTVTRRAKRMAENGLS